MFEEFNHYPKEKVKIFLRYLANAAKKEKAFMLAHRPTMQIHSNIDIEKRLLKINDERREELETKVKAYYAKNRYMPLIVRLRKIRRRYVELKNTGGSKRKLQLLKTKIEKCNEVIKKMQRLDNIKDSLAEKNY
jgi:hypothetical protein